MLILALDTTTRTGSVAVMRGETVSSLVHGDPDRTHGERLPGELDRALREAQVEPHQLDLLAVAKGPGAFTGLRIGLAAVQGVAMVLRTPVVGVSALDALALAAVDGSGDSPHRIVAWMDAQRGQVFAAQYVPAPAASLRPATEPAVGTPHEMLDALDATAGPILFIGDGAVRYRDTIVERVGAAARVMPPPGALAPFIGRLGAVAAERGETGPPHALQPLYVRRSDAELARGLTPSP